MRVLFQMLSLLVLAAPAWAAEPVWVGKFSDGAGLWRDSPITAKKTPNQYSLKDWDGVAAVEVKSKQSNSLFARPLAVDLNATPVLCWRWRIDAPIASADLNTRQGDDAAARVYINLAIPLEQQSFGVRTKLALGRAIFGPDMPDASLNYVWDNKLPVGTMLPNAFTDRVMMFVMRSGAADAGRWVSERRDVGKDAEAQFGRSATTVQLALTADTDNTLESAHAGFADLHFVARDAPCAGTR